jgi:hypothetical protein
MKNQIIKWFLRASKSNGLNRIAKISYCYIYHREIDLSLDLIFDFWCFNATFSNISAMSWRPVLVVEEAGENHRPWASNW